MIYGIAFTKNGSPNGDVLSWKQDSNKMDLTWNSFASALEACELSGWTGYVRYYPSGERVHD